MIVRVLFATGVALCAGAAMAQTGGGEAPERQLVQAYTPVEPIVLMEGFSETEDLVATPYSVGTYPRLAIHVMAVRGPWSGVSGLVLDVPVHSPDGFLGDGFSGPLYLIDLNGDRQTEILFNRTWQHGTKWTVMARVGDNRDWTNVLSFATSGFAGLPNT